MTTHPRHGAAADPQPTTMASLANFTLLPRHPRTQTTLFQRVGARVESRRFACAVGHNAGRPRRKTWDQ